MFHDLAQKLKTDTRNVCADSTNIIICDDSFIIMPMLEDKSVDIVFTSPPYNRKRNDKYDFYDDTLNDYFDFLDRVVKELQRITRKYIILNLQTNFYNKVEVYQFIGKYADKIQQMFIWNKTNPMPASGFNITNAYEIFLVLGDEPLKSNNTYTKNVITTAVNSNMPKEHKAVMRQDVCDWFIENFTKEGDVILDPFLGVGTTGISCKAFNRPFIGIEICNQYFDMSKANLGLSETVLEATWKKFYGMYMCEYCREMFDNETEFCPECNRKMTNYQNIEETK